MARLLRPNSCADSLRASGLLTHFGRLLPGVKILQAAAR